MKLIFSFLIFFLLSSPIVRAQDSTQFSQTEIIYGRKDGMALTMVQLYPTKNNIHRGIINVVSGNFISTYDWVPRYIERSKKYLDKGFTVFLVIHGSQPRYAIPDEIADIKRAVRFIRYHAEGYGIDPNKLGITGSSAGGNLALMIGLSDDKPNDSKDPVDHVSARVQAVGVFYPPTDFLNYGMQNISPLQSDMMLRKQGVAAAFDFKEWNDSTKTYTSITIPAKRLEIAKEISPAYYVTSDDPPVYIIHGDADIVVPIQQSKLLIKKLEEVKVPNHLMIVKGKGHGWKDQGIEEENLVNWFEKWLK